MLAPDGTLFGAGCEVAEDSMGAFGPLSVMYRSPLECMVTHAFTYRDVCRGFARRSPEGGQP